LITANAIKPTEGQKNTRIRTYNMLAFQMSLNGSETWTMKGKDKYRNFG
jgi:hypothetical protein